MNSRQTIKVNANNQPNSLSAHNNNTTEISIEFPLFRKVSRSDHWTDEVTLTRLDESGTSLSIRYIPSRQSAGDERVEFVAGREGLDTNVLDHTRGVGKYASSEAEFVQMAALGARLLARFTNVVGPLPNEDVEVLHHSVSQIKAANGNGQRPQQS